MHSRAACEPAVPAAAGAAETGDRWLAQQQRLPAGRLPCRRGGRGTFAAQGLYGKSSVRLKGEFQAIGEPGLEHDERYRRSREFIEALKGIWTQDDFTCKGDFYRFNHYTLSPKPIQKPHPEIFQGGSSRAARDNAAAVSDWYFTNRNTVRIGVNAFVIARATEEEAQAVLDDSIAHAHVEAVQAFGDAAGQAGRASPAGEGNWAKSTFEDLVRYNDGFRTNLIGTPQRIAERTVALRAIGVDLVLAGFLHFIEEVEYFGAKVLPLVRAPAARALEAVA